MNTITSTHQTESAIIEQPISKVWEALKSFDFHKYFPSMVKSLTFSCGSAKEVSSIFDIEFSDNSIWTFGLLEISESKRKISYELIESKPEVIFTGVYNTIKLIKVTDNNSTYIEWSNNFTNDVNSHVILDCKYKKLGCFEDMKKYFSNK